MPESTIFPIEYPPIKSAGVYYFNTSSGLRYEVRFGRRQDNILHSTIVFGVSNDEFEVKNTLQQIEEKYIVL